MCALHLEDSPPDNELLFIGFNQDYGCVACGTQSGFRIYNSDPFKETFKRKFPEGGIGIVEMLYRCNILALVGGGKHPRWPNTKVVIWDDAQNRCIGELTFASQVRAVRLRRDRIIAVLDNTTYVYNFADLKLLDQIETSSNEKGLVAVSTSATHFVVGVPGLRRGEVMLQLYGPKKTTWITAHESDLACISLNAEGSRLATASQKGTLVRVFDTINGQALQELRRGADRVMINCISFSHDSKYAAVSSNKGTIHIFNVQQEGSNDSGSLAGQEDSAENKRSRLTALRKVLPKYFSSEWSVAQFRLPDERSICAFGTDRSHVLVVSAEGNFYKCSFDTAKGGECRQEAYARFVRPSEDDF